MSKIRIRVFIQTDDKEDTYETMALFQDNILKYKEKEETTVIFNLEKQELLRENKKLKMIYPLQEKEITEGTIEVKELQKGIKVKIRTKCFERKQGTIKTVFQVEETMIAYRVEGLE